MSGVVQVQCCTLKLMEFKPYSEPEDFLEEKQQVLRTNLLVGLHVR